MQRKRILGLIIVLLLALSAGIFCACKDSGEENYYTVMLPDGEGYTVVGESIKNVKPNETVEFEIILSNGYEFIGSNIGEFKNGKLTIDKVEFSLTVDFKVRLWKQIAYVENGNVEVKSLDGELPKYGDEVDFCIVPYDNYVVEEVYLDGEEHSFIREANGSVK